MLFCCLVRRIRGKRNEKKIKEYWKNKNLNGETKFEVFEDPRGVLERAAFLQQLWFGAQNLGFPDEIYHIPFRSRPLSTNFVIVEWSKIAHWNDSQNIKSKITEFALFVFQFWPRSIHMSTVWHGIVRSFELLWRLQLVGEKKWARAKNWQSLRRLSRDAQPKAL